MRKIPLALRKEMQDDPFYQQCCITKTQLEKIEWHHNLIYAGRQVNEKWCILPLAKSVHDEIHRYRDRCDWIMLNRGTEKELKKYSKVSDYLRLRAILNNKFGEYGK